MDNKSHKQRIKELIVFAKSKMKDSPKANVIEIEPAKSEEEVKAYYRAKREEEEAKQHEEIRMKCNVCGKVFCYTLADVAESEYHEKWAHSHSFASNFGTVIDMYGQQNQAEAEKSKVVDYSRCPACHSTDLSCLSNKSQNMSADIESFCYRRN